ncbi:Protein of unknown function [Singulisphaera sp. GP187]|uniref:DUF3124 domain-containing protein n=1 Tax=Singulisphaera sp. GP187 TaxID=1882752 RepID=UPI0009289D94|nr:DUF3124 domain-containing protein [Singulisphaera sp. GP187]SIN96739.1 Protein of unknown function [Singulisphaera sp. GP187]
MTKTPTYTAVALAMTLFLSVLIFASPSSCHRDQPAEIHAPGAKARKAVVEIESTEGMKVVAGQSIYVPSYSSIYTSDRANTFFLAATLSIRNTDRSQPIVITTARYYDQDGEVIRDYLKKPLRIGPMASIEFFVPESDTSGGVSASFLVEWVADQSVNAPHVESVMIGAASTQGVALTSPGRVLSDRSRDNPPGK